MNAQRQWIDLDDCGYFHAVFLTSFFFLPMAVCKCAQCLTFQEVCSATDVGDIIFIQSGNLVPGHTVSSLGLDLTKEDSGNIYET